MIINIYQVFSRLFQVSEGVNKPFGSRLENGCSKFNHFTKEALLEIKNMGYTHVWFTGIIRHASCSKYSEFGLTHDNESIVKGVAGSPYAIKDYYDVDPDLAVDVPNRMQEFESLIQRCHDLNLNVLIDFVPNHVCREYKSETKPSGIPDLGANDNVDLRFSPTNNFYYLGASFELPDGIQFPYIDKNSTYVEVPAKATGNDCFAVKPSINDWYETVKLNYGLDYWNGKSPHFDPIPDTWYRMFEILDFWSSKGVDGFRVDMAEMVPVEFWNWVIKKIKQKRAGLIFLAEVYNPSLYRSYIFDGGFDVLYDKEEFYNYLRAILCGQASAKLISQCWKQQEGLGSHLLRFLENHDEQRIASAQFAGNAKIGFPGMILASTMHQGSVMVYFGQEIGESGSDCEGYSGSDGRTTIFDYWKIESYQKWVSNGEFNASNLSAEQQWLRNMYSRLLQLRLANASLLQSSFYDLMWGNEHNLDSDKIYAFLRHNKSQFWLVVINFDPLNQHVFNIYIPHHAFAIMGLGLDHFVSAKELLFGIETIEANVSHIIHQGISIKIEPNSGYIFQAFL
ncbi:MAG: alpha-amylase family protein [Salinivirgaceae bacterium]|nr:alpha-amylase family protein [Salinivirgaceae bacterium]MDY0279998.1 alpha-amylase family protein [Salinivirgaceae bacterium]